MNNIITDIVNMLSNLTLPDYILISAIIVLIVLVIALIYVLKNDTIEPKEESFEEHYSVLEEKPVIEEVTTDESNDLNNIVKSIEEIPTNRINMTMYEQEQENTAIISYEELLKRMNEGSIVEKEEMLDDTISIKKLNFEETKEETETNTFAKDLKEINKPEELENSFLFEYEEQEKFLKALKELDKSLNEQ